MRALRSGHTTCNFPISMGRYDASQLKNQFSFTGPTTAVRPSGTGGLPRGITQAFTKTFAHNQGSGTFTPTHLQAARGLRYRTAHTYMRNNDKTLLQSAGVCFPPVFPCSAVPATEASAIAAQCRAAAAGFSDLWLKDGIHGCAGHGLAAR